MTEIRNSKYVWVIEYWNLGFVLRTPTLRAGSRFLYADCGLQNSNYALCLMPYLS